MSYVRGLRQQKAAITNEAQTILAAAAANNRPFTAEESTRLDGLQAQAETLAASIERAARFEDDQRLQEPQPPSAAQIDPTGQFATFAEQLQAVARAARSGSEVDPRLRKISAASGLGESIPSDGGFMIAPQYASELLIKTYAQGGILSRVRKVPITQSNSMRIRAIDETSRVSGSRWGGVLMYWAAEAQTVASKRPLMREIRLDLKKLIGIAYATDELLADAAALESVISQAFSQEAVFMLEDGIMNGDGIGKPLGFMKSPSLIAQAIEAGQTIANTSGSIAINIGKLYSRCWTASINNAVWLINQELIPYLLTATVGSGAWPVYLPPGPSGTDPGIAYQPQGTIMGRPVVVVEQAQKIGTPGDIVFADLSQYLFGDPVIGLQTASSIHVRFLYDEMTFRFVYRADGLPAWNAPVSPASGSLLTQSPFVALATRS